MPAMSVVSPCGSVLSGSVTSRPTYLMLGKVSVAFEVEKPIAMFPSWSMAALPIHLCRPSAGA
jgi:hypothetical protein